MLEYIKVIKTVSFTPDSANIYVKDGKLFYSYMANIDDFDMKDDVLSDISIEEFNSQIENIKIDGWKKHYKPSRELFCDGESWTVEYKVTDKKEIVITGDNAWPANWKKFIDVIKKVIGNVNIFEY